ncbi:MAG: hypothetical protein RB288_10515 [Bacteroidales bacterium]|jgi:hypothetical protein|nr:hypothetical protein [Bacteroidales bacterium]
MQLNDNIKNSNPFKVPEGYFETLTDRTMSAITGSIKEEKAAATVDAPVRRLNLRPFLALAAAIVGFALLTTFTVRLVSGGMERGADELNGSLYADLEAEQFDIYMLEGELIEAVYYEEAAQGGSGGTLSEGTASASGDPATGEEISADAIIDYLLMEDVDINDIYELL